jgi:apolipoprotein N-acyltransferase
MKQDNLKGKNISISNGGVLSRIDILLAAASGVLLFLSFPKYGSGLLAWIALAPLFWALKKAISIRQGLILGFIAGLACHVGLIYWITYVVVNYGYLPIYLGITLMLLLACYLSLFTAAFAAGIIFFRQKVTLYFAAPVLWVCLEYCKSHILTGFPWENLGYSQYLNLYLIQFVDISGVFGLSFLIVLANATLFEVIANRTKKEFIAAAIVILITAGILIYGVHRSNQVDEVIAKNAQETSVLLIQGNIDQSIKWNKSFQNETINTYERLSLQNITTDGGLIVWPETAVPFIYQDSNDFKKRITDIAVKTKSWFIFGSMSHEQSKAASDYYNSAYILSPTGEIKGKYNKVHLVAYGEYVPLRNVFPFIRGLTEGMGDFTSGTVYTPLIMNNKKIGVLICYEGILPFAARTYKKDGAELLVNITNDAWFGATSAPFQHFSMSIFRAIETRLYLVRAANTGISAIVDPKGTVISQTNIFEKASLKGNVKFINIQTIYAKYGDVLVVACFIVLIFYVVLVLKRRLDNVSRKFTRNDK